MTIEQIIAGELSVRPQQAAATLELLDSGNTIPFIARYRKEVTGSLDEEQIRMISERAQYLRNLEERRQEILESITSQEKLTPELESQIKAAVKMQELEDLYLPYRPKKRTRAQIARERGLEPLAELIMAQSQPLMTLDKLASLHVDPEKGVNSVSEAWAGASDIVAENISDRADIRELIRKELWKGAELASTLTVDETEGQDYLMYKEYSEPVRQLPPHRILALNRGESKNCLKLTLNYPADSMLTKLAQKLKIQPHTVWNELYTNAVADSYKRLLFPSLERELRNELTEKAEKQAISVFAANLRQLLMAAPLKNRTVLGVDPGYRTGCKLAVVDETGKVLDTGVAHITLGKGASLEKGKDTIRKMLRQHHVTAVAIGNGTASRESEAVVAELLKELPYSAAYMVVSEAGASVYSASKLAAEEFPEYDVSLRSAVSIARRLQDPLAELVKIDPQAIGVGQYQHDMPKAELSAALDGVVEDCVNHVGVDLNTASFSLLSHIAGINQTIAKNIVAYRTENGAFTDRKQLKKVAKLGPKAYEQCAGFLRVPGAKNPLDNTAVHPESYSAAEQILRECGFQLADIAGQDRSEITSIAKQHGIAAIAKKAGVGEPTVKDIIKELAKPGRDPRDELPPPLLRSGDIMELKDLKPGMELVGTVRNVIDFGCFVDIGVHEDGLVHISQICDRFIKHPLEAVKVGEVVKVWVLDVDLKRKRIALTMKPPKKG
jgi:uncharacterized protein